MPREADSPSSRVPYAANHDEEPHDLPLRWTWVEPTIWSERMIAALETGVNGGRWYSLMDKVVAARTLAIAWARVQRNRGAAGVDGQSISRFAAQADRYLRELQEDLRAGRYRPQPVRRVWIEKPGRQDKRPLGIPTVKDRIVQTALKLVLEPIFEAGFSEQSYGFRPGRGCKDALRRVEALLHTGHVFVVDTDIAQYFDTIPHDRLLARLRACIADGRILGLVEQYLQSGVFDGLERWEPEAGTPQGAVISPLLANLYLNPLDQHMVTSGWHMVRYADDFVVLAGSRADAEAALAVIQGWMSEQGLTLHADKTRIVDARERGGFDFLGYHFERGMRWPKPRSTKRFRQAIKAKTTRSRGDSMAQIIAELNPIIRGWYVYYRHSHPTTFPRLDSYIRMRLRSILRKRAGRQGRGRGLDHRRWPIAYFSAHGLFTMTTARRASGGSR